MKQMAWEFRQMSVTTLRRRLGVNIQRYDETTLYAPLEGFQGSYVTRRMLETDDQLPQLERMAMGMTSMGRY